jgi:hypothetical protein
MRTLASSVHRTGKGKHYANGVHVFFDAALHMASQHLCGMREPNG